jgi:hypothetical protein
MTEREIQLLGFEVNHDDGAGCWDKYHYYTYRIANGFEFISNASDEVTENGEWFVEFFESDPAIRFHKFEEVQALINMLERNKVTK